MLHFLFRKSSGWEEEGAPSSLGAASRVLNSSALYQALPDARDNDFRNDDNHQDSQQNRSHAIPLKEIDCIIKNHANATSTHQAKHGAFADIDIPPKKRHPPKSRGNLRPGALQQHMANRRASAIERFQGAGGDFLQRLSQKLANKADAAKGFGGCLGRVAGAS